MRYRAYFMNFPHLLSFMLFATILCTTAACDTQGNQGSITMANYNAIVQSAFDTIPASQQLEDLYPETIHFMSDQQIMNSEVYLDNAMSITVQYKVEIDFRTNTVTNYHSPLFSINQYRQIEQLEGGRYQGSVGKSKFVTNDEWNAYIKSGGNVKFLGNFEPKRKLEHWDGFANRAQGDFLILDESGN